MLHQTVFGHFCSCKTRSPHLLGDFECLLDRKPLKMKHLNFGKNNIELFYIKKQRSSLGRSTCLLVIKSWIFETWQVWIFSLRMIFQKDSIFIIGFLFLKNVAIDLKQWSVNWKTLAYLQPDSIPSWHSYLGRTYPSDSLNLFTERIGMGNLE